MIETWVFSFLFFIFLLLERAYPERRWQESQQRFFSWRFIKNFLTGWTWLFLVQLFLAAWGFRLLFTWLPGLMEQKSLYHQYTANSHANWQIGLKFLFLVLALDYINYWWHRANHRFSFLRFFHRYHHSDKEVDLSTTFRFHWVELSLQFLLMLLSGALLGFAVLDVLLFQGIIYMFGSFHHSNLKFPAFLSGNILFRFIVKPQDHLVHHLKDPIYANSNYGSLFRFWDLLHRTDKSLPRSISEPGYFGAPEKPLR